MYVCVWFTYQLFIFNFIHKYYLDTINLSNNIILLNIKFTLSEGRKVMSWVQIYCDTDYCNNIQFKKHIYNKWGKYFNIYIYIYIYIYIICYINPLYH